MFKKNKIGSDETISNEAIDREISDRISELKKEQKWTDVISALKEYQEKYPKKITNYLELCIAYREAGDFPEALKTLHAAEEEGLQSPWIHDNYARLYCEQNRYEKAVRECLTALKLSDESNKNCFIELLTIIKNRLEAEHLQHRFLNISSIEIDKLLEKIFDEQIEPKNISLENEKKIVPEQCKTAFKYKEHGNKFPKPDTDVKLIAYYLPQFHPIPENDEWWGPGFTEWTNVAQAVPYFKEHYQPHVPGEFGYYDLRLPEVREAQANLAKEYGIYGFCYYYYWFEGRRLLERPLQEVFETGRPDFPFCICWANENWSRRWDGSENEILVQQVHTEKTDEDFINDVIPLFKDPRYIKVNGAPLLIIYRISLLPDPVRTAELWRKVCRGQGIPEIHLCMAETFGLTEPRQYGFNSSVQFPPHNMISGLFPQDSLSPGEENEQVQDLPDNFTGRIYNFKKVVKDQVAKELPPYNRFPGVMTHWDNTARKKNKGMLFIHSSPEAYELWLRCAIDRAEQSLPAGEQFVFINAWNEWAEGAHLEPDIKHGRGYLEATRRALMRNSDWRLMLEYAERLPTLNGDMKKQFLTDLRYSLERLSKVNEYLLDLTGDPCSLSLCTSMRPGLPASWSGLNVTMTGHSALDSLNHYHDFDDQCVAVDSFQKLRIIGWAFHCENQKLSKDAPTFLVLEAVEAGETYFTPLLQRKERPDIVESFNNPNALLSGIDALIDISMIPPGRYLIKMGCRWQQDVLMTLPKVELEIV